ncbi:MAG: hypothetical protein LBF83_01725 [Spirochaetaceae bacterium]|nr:hypothetical protein [Spirochaetaceae bacterium]
MYRALRAARGAVLAKRRQAAVNSGPDGEIEAVSGCPEALTGGVEAVTDVVEAVSGRLLFSGGGGGR